MDVLAQLGSSLKDRYELEGEIGRGGMATVYLARDVRHNRKVALKVLNPELGAVLGVERFLAEIQVTANLQHPNLLPLFDSGEADGLLFYVMPFVEGESLRALLQREKQLPIDTAVRMGAAVLSALDYAHRHGVIHRDLKPENILVHEGQPLVADFGIALAVSNAGGNRITQTGLSLGTPHYMSPEQATGDREIDGRTDVYSAGAVIYEMLVGEPPHDGKTSQAVIAKVLTDKPRRIRLSRDTVPEHVEEAVDRALAKLPADRFHSAQEFADALGARGELRHASAFSSRATETSTAPSPRGKRALLPWGVAATALLLAAVAWGSRGDAAGEPPVVRYELTPPENGRWAPGLFNIVAVGPGGGLVAYQALGEDSVSRLYLRSADDVVPRAVAGSERAILPFFSPDGEFLAFWSGSQFRKVAVNGGRPVSIVDAPPAPTTWSPSGWLVAASPQGIHRAPAAGGVFELIARVDSASGETGRTNIVALADGETVLFSAFGMGGGPTARLGIASLQDGSTTVLDIVGIAPLGMVDGFLVYATAAGVVMAVPFDLAKRRVTGTPLALIDQVAVDAATAAVHASLSADGTLAYLSGVTRRQLVLVGPDGSVRPIGEPGAITWPRFSPDGRRIAMTMGSASIRDVWIYDLPNGPASQLTRGGLINDRPEWSPDGNSIVFRSDRGGRNAIYRQSVDGAPDATLVYGRDDAHVDEGVLSPDGATLAVQRDATGDGEVWLVPLRDGGEARRFDPLSGLYGARFSPDGRWLAYAGGAGGGEQVVYVRASTGEGRATRISNEAGTTPVWAPDGRRLFYVNGRELMVVNVESTSPFRVGSPRRALTGTYTFNSVHADYDISRDGRSILALRSPEQSARIVVVRNLGSELRARFRQAPR